MKLQKLTETWLDGTIEWLEFASTNTVIALWQSRNREGRMTTRIVLELQDESPPEKKEGAARPCHKGTSKAPKVKNQDVNAICAHENLVAIAKKDGTVYVYDLTSLLHVSLAYKGSIGPGAIKAMSLWQNSLAVLRGEALELYKLGTEGETCLLERLQTNALAFAWQNEGSLIFVDGETVWSYRLNSKEKKPLLTLYSKFAAMAVKGSCLAVATEHGDASHVAVYKLCQELDECPK